MASCSIYPLSSHTQSTQFNSSERIYVLYFYLSHSIKQHHHQHHLSKLHAILPPLIIIQCHTFSLLLFHTINTYSLLFTSFFCLYYFMFVGFFCFYSSFLLFGFGVLVFCFFGLFLPMQRCYPYPTLPTHTTTTTTIASHVFFLYVAQFCCWWFFHLSYRCFIIASLVFFCLYYLFYSIKSDFLLSQKNFDDYYSDFFLGGVAQVNYILL